MVLLFWIPLGLIATLWLESSFSAPVLEFDPGADIAVYAVNIVALRKVFAYTFGLLDHPLVE
jgi:hypothetical protein